MSRLPQRGVISDALACFLVKGCHKSAFVLEIVRESGSPVTEIKQMAFATTSDGSTLAPVRITRTKRVGFRDQVRPGEAVFVRARVVPGDQ